MTSYYGFKFNLLAARWKRETMFLSSITAMAEHPAYKEIIAMGKIVLPLIFERLNHKCDFWYMALAQITKHDIELAEDEMGKIDIICEKWKQWGRDNGYL